MQDMIEYMETGADVVPSLTNANFTLYLPLNSINVELSGTIVSI